MNSTIRESGWIRGALAAALALVLSPAAGLHAAKVQEGQGASSGGISVEPSEEIFATMCALDAAGFDADESTLAEMPARLKLRGDLLNLQGPATQELRRFYRDHVLADPGETLSRYITFALVIGPPPNFEYTVDHDLLPPDVLSIENFQPILANFYREAHLGAQWAQIEPEYDGPVERYGPVVRRIVVTTNAYLRELLRPATGRTFTVYVEPLVGERTNFRNSGDHYAIVVGTREPLPVADIQHAYLHFMLDSLPLKYRDQINTKSALLNIAARAPELPPEYQNDFVSFTDECLVKAVELRLKHLAPDKEEETLAEDDREGYILVRPIVQQLQKFEKTEPSMTYYFPDILSHIDVAAEQKRLQNFAFAKPQAAPVETPKPVAAPASAMDQLLAEGDRQIALQNPAAAAAAFQKVLDQDATQPRAMYGLAVASLMSGQGDEAMRIFQALVSAPDNNASTRQAEAIDPAILAWSHVYLGRLYDLQDERDQALVNYRAALGVNGAPETARVAAQRGIDEVYRPPVPGKPSRQ
jgi:tetratricopeptide (TPR) repeat protein